MCAEMQMNQVMGEGAHSNDHNWFDRFVVAFVFVLVALGPLCTPNG